MTSMGRGEPRVSESDRFFGCRHSYAMRSGLHHRPGYRHDDRAVAVGVGFHCRQETDTRLELSPQEADIPPYGGKVYADYAPR